MAKTAVQPLSLYSQIRERNNRERRLNDVHSIAYLRSKTVQPMGGSSVKPVGVPIAIGSANQVVEMLKSGEADAYSNLTHLLSLTQTELPGWRIVPGSYMGTVFSIAYPKGRPARATYANQFIEEMKKHGFIQQAIERANLKGATVPK